METMDFTNSTQNEQLSNSEIISETTAIQTNDSENASPIEEPIQVVNETIIQPKIEEPLEELIEETVSNEDKDYSVFNKDALIIILKELVQNKQINDIKYDIENIKINFYKKHKSELDAAKKKFLDEGGVIEDYKTEPDALELELKEIYKKYKEDRVNQNVQIEKEKQENLKAKNKVIEEIKLLIDSTESVGKTFNEFRNLQKKWNDTGLVPQAEMKNLWENYHLVVENFYNYVKINQELRDLDLKKNLEAKMLLCEKAEELFLESQIRKAFEILQELHIQWREIGPVTNEKKDEIWERFKEATTKINKKYQDFYENQKQEQENNFESKTMICDKAEEIAGQVYKAHNEWDEKTNEIIELQKMWKTIGFAPKKVNNLVYERFRTACDTFFSNKKEYYDSGKELQNNNLQLKTELCIQAEAIKDSTDWKKATDDFIRLQKKWKEIGPVPRKYADDLWKRFRAACDAFFNNKQNHFSSIDGILDENLKRKEELIEQIEKFVLTADSSADLEILKKFQKDFTEIGHVPFKVKDKIQKQFRAAINTHFDNLKIDEHNRSILRFKNKMEDLSQEPRSTSNMKSEQMMLIKKLHQIESDITLWENNIGFFAQSKNADVLIKDFHKKIEQAKESAKIMKEKLNYIDKMMSEMNIR